MGGEEDTDGSGEGGRWIGEKDSWNWGAFVSGLEIVQWRLPGIYEGDPSEHP